MKTPIFSLLISNSLPWSLSEPFPKEPARLAEVATGIHGATVWIRRQRKRDLSGDKSRLRPRPPTLTLTLTTDHRRCEASSRPQPRPPTTGELLTSSETHAPRPTKPTPVFMGFQPDLRSRILPRFGQINGGWLLVTPPFWKIRKTRTK